MQIGAVNAVFCLVCKYNFADIFHFLLIRVKFGKADGHKNVLSTCEFPENLCNESHALLLKVNEYLPVLVTSTVQLR